MPSHAMNNSFNISNTIIWNVPSLVRMNMSIIQTLLNSSMLVAFVIRKELRTSFAVYLVFLFVSNIIYAAGQYPLEVIRQGFPRHWWLSSSACTFYIYQTWVFCPVVMHTHVLITFNRIWAIAFPVSYKNVHSEKVAVIMCALMVVYVHLVCLPVVVLDVMYYRLIEVHNGCFLNTEAQSVFTTIVAIVSTDVPIAVVVGTYPFLWYKNVHRTKIRHADPSRREVSVGAKTRTRTISTLPKRAEASTLRPFLVLTLLTVSVLVCWTPDQVSWTVACFTAVNDSPGLRYTTSVLFTLQAAFDPVLFALSLRTFRNMLSRALCCWRPGGDIPQARSKRSLPQAEE